VEEMGHLQKLQEKYGKNGLVVFAIAVNEDLPEIRKLTKEKGWTFAIFNGVGSALAKQYAYG
jgi:tRNA(Ile)-lysidine synthase TilS/MesJ